MECLAYLLTSFHRSCVRRSNLIKDDPMHGLYGLENLAFNARRSSNTADFQFGKDAALYVHSFVLYTPFLKGRTASTNSRFKYVPLVFED